MRILKYAAPAAGVVTLIGAVLLGLGPALIVTLPASVTAAVMRATR